MSPRLAPSASSGGSAKSAITVLLVVVVAIGMVMLVRARPAPGPFDPRSGAADGTRGLVLLLEEQGAAVDIDDTPPRPGDGVRVLVLVDDLDDDQRAALIEFVEAGGVALVADPASTLHGGHGVGDGGIDVPGATTPDGDGLALAEVNVPRRSCTIDALTHLRGLYSPNGVLLGADDADPHCFGDGNGHAFAVRRDVGRGAIVGLGDNRVFTNANLRFADNAGLGTALLAPAGGRVLVMLGRSDAGAVSDLGEGDDTLLDLVRPGVWMGLAQLALAFVVLAVARGVRVGRPVDEPLPTPVAGSELVRARAALMHRAGHAAQAGAVLQHDLSSELRRREHLTPDAPIDDVAAEVARRGGIAAPDVVAVLTAPADDPAQLLALSNDVAALRARLDQPEPAADLPHTPDPDGATR